MASSLGLGVRNVIRNILANANFRSSITLTPITKTEGAEGGYEGATKEEGTSRTVYYANSEYLKNSVDSETFGDSDTGELDIFIRDDETIDTDDKFTLDSNNYSIQEIKPIVFNEVTVAQRISLSKKLI